MVELTAVVLAATRVLVLGMGVLITHFSLKAYRRTGEPYMRNASIGFGVITLGVFIEGVLFEVIGLDLAVVHVIESVAIGIGFLVLLLSLRQ